MPLLNTKSLLLIFLWNLKHNHQLQYQEERSIAHNTGVFPGKHKAKNPTIIYYVYHGSWNNLIQNSNPRALSTIQSSLTVIQKLTNSCANILSPDNLPPLRNPCNGKPTKWFECLLPRLHIAHGKIHCVCDCMSALHSNHNW